MTETVKYTHFELAIQKRVASSTWNIGKTSRELDLEHWENESRARLGTLGKRVARSSWDIGKRVARSSWGIGKRVARSCWGFPKQPTARSNDTLPRS